MPQTKVLDSQRTLRSRGNLKKSGRTHRVVWDLQTKMDSRVWIISRRHTAMKCWCGQRITFTKLLKIVLRPWSLKAQLTAQLAGVCHHQCVRYLCHLNVQQANGGRSGTAIADHTVDWSLCSDGFNFLKLTRMVDGGAGAMSHKHTFRFSARCHTLHSPKGFVLVYNSSFVLYTPTALAVELFSTTITYKVRPRPPANLQLGSTFLITQTDTSHLAIHQPAFCSLLSVSFALGSLPLVFFQLAFR